MNWTFAVEQLTHNVFLHYIPQIAARIGHLMSKHNVIYKPTKNIKEYLKSAKDRKDPLSIAGVYGIPRISGSVYVVTSGRSVNTRQKGHKNDCRLRRSERSNVTEHTLLKAVSWKHYFTRLYREAVDIQKHKNNFNRTEESIKISSTWKPIKSQNSAFYIN